VRWGPGRSQFWAFRPSGSRLSTTLKGVTDGEPVMTARCRDVSKRVRKASARAYPARGSIHCEELARETGAAFRGDFLPIALSLRQTAGQSLNW